MRAKEFELKHRDPNWKTLQAKRISGAAGAHKDQKRSEKQGDIKHKKPYGQGMAEGESQYTDMSVAQDVYSVNPNLDSEDDILNAAFPFVVKMVGGNKKRANYMFNYDEDFPGELISAYKWLQRQEHDVGEAGGYDQGRADPRAPSLGAQDRRDFKRAELQHELGHERNNIAVSINGKLWKVFQGKGTADSFEERQYLTYMRVWAEKKSAVTGKKWSVSLTGAEPTA
jgi:hypothetical protein